MTLVQITQYDSSGGDPVPSTASRERKQSFVIDTRALIDLFRAAHRGSAGVVKPVHDYGLLFPRVGTSPSVVDTRSIGRVDPEQVAPATSATEKATEAAPSTLRTVLALSVVEQMREVLAALSVNKSQLAEVLGVSRPTLYDWFDGKEPNPSNAQRLTTVLRLLTTASVSHDNPLSPRFLHQPLSEGGIALFDALSAELLDERLILSLVCEAKALGEEAGSRRGARETRLRALGFEDPSDETRRELLARNIAMSDWPKR